MHSRSELPLLLESAHAPVDLGLLGGEVRELPAKTDEFRLEPGDVLLYSWSGGGFGDPLERDLERVAADVEADVVSEQKGQEVYGLGADRDELRRERLERAHAGIRVPASLELAAYLCLACGVQHAVDVREVGAAPIQDVRLTATTLAAGATRAAEGDE